MATIITYPSALQYWLFEEGIPYQLHINRNWDSAEIGEILRFKMIRKDIIKTAKSLCFPAPVHVSVAGPLKRNSTQDVVFHKLSLSLPENSFYKFSDDLYIASPELCFVLAAEHLSIHELVVLANDLCGIYIKDKNEDYGQRRRDPVTTVKSIRSYINSVKNFNGIKNAKTAIQYALDRSNSPMESKLAAIAVLPVFRGGYGVIKPQLNLDVRLNKEAIDFSGYTYLCCDMVWLVQKVILEYDSNLSHLHIQQHFKDKKRVTALTMSGFRVISITAEQIKNFHSIENTFLQLRHVLGMRTYKERTEKFFSLRWKVVHDIFFKDSIYE